MDIEGHQEPKQTITSAEKVMDMSKYESIPYPAIQLVASIDYVVEKYGIQNPAVIEVGPVPGEYYEYPEPGKKYTWATQHYAFTPTPERNPSKGGNPPIRYLADLHPEWKLVALGVHDISQELKETLLGTHSDLYLYDTGNAASKGLSTSTSYYHPEEDVAEEYPKLIEKLGGKRPDIISARQVLGNTGALIFDGDEMMVTACILLPIGGFLIVTYSEADEETGEMLPSNPKSFPFDMKQNMKLVTIMDFPSRSPDDEYRPRALVYQKVGDVINPAHLEDMEQQKKVRDELRVEGWKPGQED